MADTIRDIPLTAKWNNFLTKNRQSALSRVDELLSQAVREDELNYQDACADDPAPERITPRGSPFCINLILPEEQRRRAALESRDDGVPVHILDILGDAGNAALRARLTQLCEAVLRRPDCDPLESNSSAFFDAIIAISIADWSKSGKRLEFLLEGLDFLISADLRHTPNALVDVPFDLSEVISNRIDLDDHPRPPATLRWRLSGATDDVPVEYSLMILAKVRDGEEFRDITTYGQLLENYEKNVQDLRLWRPLARYYGVKPPPELLQVEDGTAGTPPEATPSVNGQPAHAEMVRDSA